MTKKTAPQTATAVEATPASREDLLSAVTPVKERELTVTLADGRPRTLTLRAFEFTDQLRAMYAEAQAISKHPTDIPLPPGDPSGRASFRPTEDQVYTAAFLTHIVAAPKMGITEWLIFARRNSFQAAEISAECLKVAGLAPEDAPPSDPDDDAPVQTFGGVAEARGRLLRNPFQADGAGEQPQAPAPAPG